MKKGIPLPPASIGWPVIRQAVNRQASCLPGEGDILADSPQSGKGDRRVQSIDHPQFVPYDKGVPEISRFLGIVIAMFYRDHEPGHFHAYYGEFEITVDIESGVVSGQFPRRALAHVLEWYELHKQDLKEDWKLARERRPLNKISPLE